MWYNAGESESPPARKNKYQHGGIIYVLCPQGSGGFLWWVGGNDRRLGPVRGRLRRSERRFLQFLSCCWTTRPSCSTRSTRRVSERILRERRPRSGRAQAGLSRRPPHGAGPLRHHRASWLLRYPEIEHRLQRPRSRAMMQQFFGFDIDSTPAVLVKEGDTFCTGRHTLTFVMAPMVHWPEVMVTYDATTRSLFSADAFGTFGALNGALFADEVDFFARLCGRGPPLLLQHRRQIRHAGAGPAQEGLHGPDRPHLPPARLRLAQKHRRIHRPLRPLEHLYPGGAGRHDRLRLRLRRHGERGRAAVRPPA